MKTAGLIVAIAIAALTPSVLAQTKTPSVPPGGQYYGDPPCSVGTYMLTFVGKFGYTHETKECPDRDIYSKMDEHGVVVEITEQEFERALQAGSDSYTQRERGGVKEKK